MSMKEKVEATFTKFKKVSKSKILTIQNHLMPYSEVVDFTAVLVTLATAVVKLASSMVIYFIGSPLSSPSSSDSRMP